MHPEPCSLEKTGREKDQCVRGTPTRSLSVDNTKQKCTIENIMGWIAFFIMSDRIGEVKNVSVVFVFNLCGHHRGDARPQ